MTVSAILVCKPGIKWDRFTGDSDRLAEQIRSGLSSSSVRRKAAVSDNSYGYTTEKRLSLCPGYSTAVICASVRLEGRKRDKGKG